VQNRKDYFQSSKNTSKDRIPLPLRERVREVESSSAPSHYSPPVKGREYLIPAVSAARSQRFSL
jgi:hypothetical protein